MSKDPEGSKMSDDVVLKMKLEDVLSVVAKSSVRPIMDEKAVVYNTEGEDIKKAWFRHVLYSMEKLNDLVEKVRSVDIPNLKADLKDEIYKVENRLERAERQVRDHRQESLTKIDKVDVNLLKKFESTCQELLSKTEEVKRDLKAHKVAIESKFKQVDEEFSTYNKEVVDPMRMKILTISVKLGVWAAIAGVIGSGLFAGVWVLIKFFFPGS